MQQRRLRSLLFPLALATACDDPGTPDRGEDDPGAIDFRTGGSETWSGSTRLNTSKLFAEGMPVRHFDRDGDLVTYDDARATKVKFLSIRLAGGAVYDAPGHTLVFEQGKLKVDGTLLAAGALLGSEWSFEISDTVLPVRPFVLRVTGVAIATIPGGATLPLYNFSATALTKYYDNGPYSACDALDARAAGGVVTQAPDVTPPGEVNNFRVEYAAVLYGGVKVSELGVVASDSAVATMACVSGAVGKAGLWGYPSWVGSYLGRTGVQQLQAATRAIRADYCGNGTSHTEDGTAIQIRDRYFGQFDDPIEATESIWATNGSVCKVNHDRLETGATFACGGGLTTSCEQSAADWINGPDQFMWIKVDPAITPFVPQHPCSVTSATPGCADPGIEATVCAADPHCCSTQWDAACVAAVTSLGAAADACCVDNGSPGCGDAGVTACVSAYDPSCATTRWDSYCAIEVEALDCGRCH